MTGSKAETFGHIPRSVRDRRDQEIATLRSR